MMVAIHKETGMLLTTFTLKFDSMHNMQSYSYTERQVPYESDKHIKPNSCSFDTFLQRTHTYTNMHTRTCIHIHTSTHTNTYTYTNSYIHMHTYTTTCIQTCTYIHTNTHTYTYTDTHTQTCI